MEAPTHSLKYELPQELHFDKYAQHILENSRTSTLGDSNTIGLDSTPSKIIFDSSPQYAATSELLKKLGATFIHSIQLQSFQKTNPLDTSLTAPLNSNMDLDFAPNHLIMDSRNYNMAMGEMKKQLEYDQLMNEVWICVVLTLVAISMTFCFCSCFLYHQFRVWKRNYRTTVTQSIDVEADKLDLTLEDPVPEYTLVSGLPSYEAALELLQKNPQTCLIVHPTVFEVFNRNEKHATETVATVTDSSEVATTFEAAVPLLGDSSTNTNNTDKTNSLSYTEATTTTSPVDISLPSNHSLVSILSLASHKSQFKNKSTAATTPSPADTEKQTKS